MSFILDTIGSTPLVDLRRLVPRGSARIALKLESQNPTGSMKDRMARAMIECAEADGRLAPGREVVEFTGGSTGTSLAFVCAAKKYPLPSRASRRAMASASSVETGATVLAIACDTGLKYVSTELYR